MKIELGLYFRKEGREDVYSPFPRIQIWRRVSATGPAFFESFLGRSGEVFRRNVRWKWTIEHLANPKYSKMIKIRQNQRREISLQIGNASPLFWLLQIIQWTPDLPTSISINQEKRYDSFFRPLERKTGGREEEHRENGRKLGFLGKKRPFLWIFLNILRFKLLQSEYIILFQK